MTKTTVETIRDLQQAVFQLCVAVHALMDSVVPAPGKEHLPKIARAAVGTAEGILFGEVDHYGDAPGPAERISRAGRYLYQAKALGLTLVRGGKL